ncbi:hypothetical protein A0H81_03750 [Grifola frondosa]|uniref:Uncharacterized protein n=1 Tax=Grifola frondosa TaxID=5627 RepID=A0A1C7MJD0_GRIFR|nr:hypothetical protein A0H81_03750 [Grifola frondosa]
MFRFADAIPTINMLAPLFDRMTTHVISQRFTAAQAYAFWIEFVRSLSDEELSAEVTVSIYGDDKMTVEECWNRIPPAFAKLWSHYRSPSIPNSIRLLHWVCSYETGARFVRYVRKTFRI